MFVKKTFMARVFDGEWEGKELKDRLRHVTISMHECLPESFIESVNILLDVNEGLDNKFQHFVLPDFVAVYGLDHFEDSMFALKVKDEWREIWLILTATTCLF